MMAFAFNQPVTLKSDPAFLGFYWGNAMSDDGIERVMVAVKKPGKTGKHVNSNWDFPAAEIVAVDPHKLKV